MNITILVKTEAKPKYSGHGSYNCSAKCIMIHVIRAKTMHEASYTSLLSKNCPLFHHNQGGGVSVSSKMFCK